MIPAGKLFVALIWTFWLLASGSVADGSDNITLVEYNPTYGTTFNREIERGYVI